MRPPARLRARSRDAPIRSGADLNGKTIAVNGLRDLTQVALQSWIDASFHAESAEILARYAGIPADVIRATTRYVGLAQTSANALIWRP